MPTIGFRLVIRDVTDTTDELIISSVPDGDNPYLTEPPTVDGASADLLHGTTDVGSAVIRFWDELTTVAAPTVLAVEDWAEYDPTASDGDPDAFVRTGRWSRVGPYTGSVGVVITGAPDGNPEGYAVLAGLDIGDTGSAYVTRTEWGLPASTDVTVEVPYEPGLFGGGNAGVVVGELEGYGHSEMPKVGARVESVESATRGAWPPEFQGAEQGAAPPPPYTWSLKRFFVTTAADGTLPVDLGIFDYVNLVGIINRGATYGTIRILEGHAVGGLRLYTARLHEVQDGVARLTQLSRVCRIDQTVDGGETWTTFHRGYLNRLEVEGGEWTVTVGDTTRREQQTELFATLPTLDPSTLDDPLPIPAPRVGLILGGPIASDATYGAFAGLKDYGPTRWKVEETLTDHAGDDRLVRLKFVSGYLRPWFDRQFSGGYEQDEWEKVNNAGRPYFVWDPARYESHPYPTSTVNSFGYFPDLVMRLDPVAGGDVLEKVPISRPIKHEPDDKHTPKAEYDALTGNDSVIYVDWGPTDPFPDVDDEFDVTLHSPVISDKNPLLLAGHPVDLVAYAASLSGIPCNAASRVSARAALGAGLWCELKITGAQKFSEFQKALGGFFGFLFRPDVTTGERHFVPTRVRPDEPVAAITNADRIGGGEDGSLPPVWAAEEDSVVNVVKFSTLRFRFFRYKEDSGDPPVHMLAEAKAEVEGKRGAAATLAVNGERTQTYEIPGQLQRRAADGTVTPLILATRDAANPGYAEDAGGVIVDFAGWGVPQTVVAVDAASEAAAAQLGDELTVDLPDLPVPVVGATPLTYRGAGPRVARVVKRDPAVGQVTLTLAHAGELSQDAVAAPASGGSADPGTPTVPTLGLAASASAPTTVVTVTLTNGADLSADNLRTELEYLAQAGTPASTDEGADFGPVSTYPDGDLTTIDTPSVPPGSTVWVRARSVNVTSGVASAWTAWASVTLGVVENGGGSPDERPYAPTLTLTPVVNATTGVTSATASPSAGVTSVKFAAGAAGGAPPSLADVRAASADTSDPFTSGTLATLAAGEVRTIGALAYDAAGNESALAVVLATRGDPTAGAGQAATVGAELFAAGDAADRRVPVACTITRADIHADVSGSAVVDVLMSTDGGVTFTSIAASAKPSLSSAQTASDTTLTGWTTAAPAGAFLRFVLDSLTTSARVNCDLTLVRS